MEYDTTLAEQAYALAAKWDSARDISITGLSFKANDVAEFNTNQIGVLFFLPLKILQSVSNFFVVRLSN